MWQRKFTSSGIAYCEQGHGPKMVFLHGLGLRAECWAEQIEALVDHYSLLVLDLPGHGESVMSKASPHTSDAPSVKVALIDPIVQALGELNVQSAIVVGHSLGALIAVELSYIYPALCAGVVPISVIFNRSEKASKAVQNRARQLRHSPTDSERVDAPISRWFGESPSGVDLVMAQRCRDWILRGDVTGYANAYSLFAHYPGFDLEQLKGVNQPMLFITGECDSNSTPAMSEALAAHITNGEALIVESARHMLQLTHAQEVNQALLNFARRCTIRPLNSENFDGEIDG